MVGEQEKYLLRDLLEVNALANIQNSAVSSGVIKRHDGLLGFTIWPQRTEGNIGSCSLSSTGSCGGSFQVLPLLKMLLWSSSMMNETLFLNHSSINIFHSVCENAGSWVYPPFSFVPCGVHYSLSPAQAHLLLKQLFSIWPDFTFQQFSVTYINKVGTFYSCKSSFKFCWVCSRGTISKKTELATQRTEWERKKHHSSSQLQNCIPFSLLWFSQQQYGQPGNQHVGFLKPLL